MPVIVNSTILISRKEAARLLGVSVGTLDRLVRQGQIKPVRIGGRVLLKRECIENFEGEKFWFPLPPEVERQLQEMERQEAPPGEMEESGSIVN